MPATLHAEISHLTIDANLLDATVMSVQAALGMCGVKANCVGVSRVPARNDGAITGMIGIHGAVSGFVTLNMSERLATKAVGGLLGEEFDTLTSQVVDGAGELTNIAVGGMKSALSRTEWAFSNITVPSVIVGEGYSIAFARGLEFLCVTLEHDDSKSVMLSDRLLHVTLSLLKK